MNSAKVQPLFLLILIAFPLFAVVTLAQVNFPDFPFNTWFSPEALATFLGVPSDWLVIPRVIYYVLVPFIVAFTVTYAILTELRLFRNAPAAGKIYAVLAFAMSFLLLPSGILTVIVTYFYAAGVFIGLVAFGALFIGGTLLWAWGRGRLIRHEYGLQADIAGGLREKMKDHQEMIKRLQKEILEKRARGEDTTSLESQLFSEKDALTKEAERLRGVMHAPI